MDTNDGERPSKRVRVKSAPKQDARRFHVILLLDLSASMKLECRGALSRLDAAWDAMMRFTRTLVGLREALFSLVTFDDGYTVKVKQETIGAHLLRRLSEIRSSLVPSGGGRYVQALQAVRTLVTGCANVGVLLSDGVPTELAEDFYHGQYHIDSCLASMRRELSNRCIIYTIGFGKFDAACLKSIAKVGGGQYFENATLDFSALTHTFGSLSATVSTLHNSVFQSGGVMPTPLPSLECESNVAWEKASLSEIAAVAEEKNARFMLPEEGSIEGELKPRGQAMRVLWHHKPFAQGALRYAFHLWVDISKDGVDSKLHLVTKKNKHSAVACSPLQVQHVYLSNHRRAQVLASHFNQAVASIDGSSPMNSRKHNVKFVPAHVLQISSGSASGSADSTEQGSFLYVAAEKFIAGDFVKLNGNDGYVNSIVPDEIANVAAAFSHFSFDHTSGQEMCVDLQGVGLLWTDPQFHSLSRDYGLGDCGKKGMQRFFKSHACSEYRCKLKLRNVHPDSLKFGEALTLDAFERSQCLICWNGRRVAACRPCGHLCFCSKCASSTALPRCPLCRQPVVSVRWADDQSSTVCRDSRSY